MSRFRVLLVEDQAEVREITTHLLRNYGYDVIEAPTGAEGIKLAKVHKIDAALIDLGLPDMDGQDVAKALGHLRLAILTGNSDDLNVPEAMIILQKPLAPGELLDALRVLVPESAGVNSRARA
jgi:two-component system KDP operon response regulator KdpE